MWHGLKNRDSVHFVAWLGTVGESFLNVPGHFLHILWNSVRIIFGDQFGFLPLDAIQLVIKIVPVHALCQSVKKYEVICLQVQWGKSLQSGLGKFLQSHLRLPCVAPSDLCEKSCSSRSSSTSIVHFDVYTQYACTSSLLCKTKGVRYLKDVWMTSTFD